jgi:dihydrofolate synthase/folylpolyglutamate synthase
VVACVTANYRYGEPRRDLTAVEELRTKLAPIGVPHYIVVVGSNGKTSTATYLARLLCTAGVHVGLYTSPHLCRWTERVTIDGRPCTSEELLATLRCYDAIAQAQSTSRHALRFFDLLTLVADELFGRHGVQVGVFESGIGGRLDATRVLRPGLVALSSVGYDHQELLGETLQEILIEKLEVAPEGASLVSARLPDELRTLQRTWASAHDVALSEVGDSDVCEVGAPADLPPFQRRNLALALASARTAVSRFSLPIASRDHPKLDAIDLAVAGRFERGKIAGVPYLADAAHNVTAWSELVSALNYSAERFLVVVALTLEREPRELAAVLERSPKIDGAIATTTRLRAGHAPAELRAALAGGPLPVSAFDLPERAFEVAIEQARLRGTSVLVTGSSYLVAEFLAWRARQKS